jgi:hypothetical protein
MATVKRWGSGRQGTYRGPDGRERTRTFRLNVEAEGWVSEQNSAMRHGDWIDLIASRLTFGEFALAWQAAQVHRATTAALVDSHLRRISCRPSAPGRSPESGQARSKHGCEVAATSSLRRPSRLRSATC